MGTATTPTGTADIIATDSVLLERLDVTPTQIVIMTATISSTAPGQSGRQAPPSRFTREGVHAALVRLMQKSSTWCRP
jgi:hypothetical protein